MASDIDADKLVAFEAMLLEEQKRRAKPIDTIIMGVQRSPEFLKRGSESGFTDGGDPATNPYDQHSEASRVASPPPAPLPATALHEIDTSPPEGPYHIHAQVRGPDERGDPGEIAEGTYTIKSGIVDVEDDQGQPLGRQRLAPGEDGKAAARAILRAKKAPSQFWGPINYSNSVH
jgi:hypothetical protein